MHVVGFGSMLFIFIAARVSKSVVLVSRLCDLWPSEEWRFSRECFGVPTLWATELGVGCDPRLQNGNTWPCGRLRHPGNAWRVMEGGWEMSYPKRCYQQQDFTSTRSKFLQRHSPSVKLEEEN